MLDFETLDYTDEATWNLICSGKTIGIFQLESHLGREWSSKIKPRNIRELADVISVIRPGTLEVKENGKTMTQIYQERKAGIIPTIPIHPILEPILRDTYQIICFQEQAMAIANRVAGFTLEETDTLRKSIGKKDSKLLASIRDGFVDGCIKTSGLSSEEANNIFDIIEKSGRYSFNLCCSGDTKLFRHPGRHKTSLTIRDMYLIKNDIKYAKETSHIDLYKKFKLFGYGKTLSLFSDGRIRENSIVDIRYQGKQKLYRITLDNGSYIETTDNHKYPTPIGERILSELKIGDSLFIKGERTPEDIKSFSKKYGYSNISKNELKLRKVTNKGTMGFVCGEKNPGYTNGVYTEFVKNKKMIPMFCVDCGPREATYPRLETHHVDGNRENSTVENLVNLCPSCHKKREYASGRTRRGEVGYPSLTSSIVSIEYVGENDVYDIEMASPSHNFVTDSGIVTCNSHAVGYAKISFATAWEKTHKPMKFYCDWLSDCKNRVNGKMELRQLINDAKGFGVKINGPSISHIEEEFYIHDNEVYFGLANIKDIGHATASPFLEFLKTLDKPISELSWFEIMSTILENAEISIGVGLISTGAFSGHRKRMLYEFKTWKSLTGRERAWIIGKKGSEPFDTLEKAIESLLNSGYSRRQIKIEDLFTLLKNPPHNLEDDNNWIIRTEQEMLGFPISVDRIEKSKIPDTTCEEVLLGRVGEMTIGVEIQRVREHTIKSGKNAGNKMAFIGATDGTELDCVAFTDVWQEEGYMLYEGNCVALTIVRSDRGGFIIQKVYQL